MSATTEWTIRSLDDLAERIDYGHTASADRAAVGPKFLRITDIQSGHVDWNTVPHCPVFPDELDKYRLNDGDIVFARTGNTTGKSFLLKEPPKDSVFASYLIRVRPSRLVDPRFLAHFFDTPNYWNQIEKNTQGAGQPGVNATRLKTIEIPLPPLSEQKRIADILDKADSIRRKRQEARTNSDALIASSFREKFGDPVTNSMGLETIPLSDYGIVTTGNTPSRKDPDNYGDAIEWIKSDNINTPSHWLTKSTEGLSEKGRAIARTVPAGSTLVTCIAGSPACVGNAAMTDRTVAFNQQINAVTPRREVDPYFLYSLILLSQPLVQRASTASMKGMVSKGKFEQVQVIKVNEREQKAFGRVFQQILQLVNRNDQASASSNDLFESLVQRAFKGEL